MRLGMLSQNQHGEILLIFFGALFSMIFYINEKHLALIDEEMYEKLSKLKWKVVFGYAVRSEKRVNGIRPTLSMHRLIMDLSKDDKFDVDHINGNRLDNRRQNLRVCTRAENCRNRKISPKNKSGYKGVDLIKKSGKFRACIVFNGKQKYLGLFHNAEDAHKAYCEAAVKFHLEFARFK